MKLTKIKSVSNIDFYTPDTTTELTLPFVTEGISAGFPSPAADYLDLSLDLNKELIKNASSTFYGRVRGTSMKDAGILEGDVLIIDKSLPLKDGSIAVCFIDGEFTVKKVKIGENDIYLIPANEEYKPIQVTKDNDFLIWGIVTYIIKKV